MNKIKKIIALMIIIGIVVQNAIAFAGVIDIGDISLIKRGSLGAYAIQRWYEEKQDWRYITYSRTYYVDKEGNERIAYCIDQDLDGVGWIPGEYDQYEATITKKIDDEKLWRVYKNGYPYVSPEELGVESEDDAYLATKQAAYFIIKGKSEDEVYATLRPGQTAINGQTVEDLQRRGSKIVNAIYNLVSIGNNGTEHIPTNSIQSIGNFKQDSNGQYYSQEYKINSSYSSDAYKIIGIDGAPQGTYIADLNGNLKSVFYGGESFKIIVPKDNIDKDYNIKIRYKKEISSYPIYYAMSNKEGTQNYVVIADKNESINNSIDLLIQGNKSNINILKIDEETKKPIEGVKFSVKYEEGENIGEFITNKEGKIRIENIYQGKVILKEITTNNEYEIDTTPKEINVEYNSSYNIEITNKHKKGSLEIKKVDLDNSDVVLQGVEFDLINSIGEVEKHLVTNEEGVAKIDNLNTGEYILQETKTKEEYKIASSQNIVINWNEKLGLIVENEKKKGNLKVIKIDADNSEVKISGVEFNLMDEEGNILSTAITDKNGEIYIQELPIGKYILQETKTTDKYILNEDKKEVQIIEDKTTEVTIKNEKIKGKIQIVKTSEDANNILHKPAGEAIPDVKFAVYNEKGKIVQELETDEKGIAQTDLLEKGKYTIRETQSGKWYLLNDNIYEAEIKENGDIIQVDVTNKSEDPSVDIEKRGAEAAKPNQEIEYNFEIKNTGNVKLSKFTWYDFLPYEKAKVTKMSTGTYNQDINYSVYYKTNRKEEYMVLKKDLSSKENNYLDFTQIPLQEGESITEIKVDFENVDIGFESEEKPKLYIKVNSDVKDMDEIKNETILEAYHKDYKVCDEDHVETIIENKPILKKLPRTGY